MSVVYITVFLMLFTGYGQKTTSTLKTHPSIRGDRDRKIGHRRVDSTGQVSYKKVQEKYKMELRNNFLFIDYIMSL